MMFVVTVVLIYTLLFKPELIISIKHDAIADFSMFLTGGISYKT